MDILSGLPRASAISLWTSEIGRSIEVVHDMRQGVSGGCQPDGVVRSEVSPAARGRLPSPSISHGRRRGAGRCQRMPPTD
jgi:hypothetical protein